MAIRLQEVVVFLSEGLQAKVFTEKTETQLQTLADVLDSSGLKKQISSSSVALTASLTWAGFYSAVQRVDSKLQVGL